MSHANVSQRKGYGRLTTSQHHLNKLCELNIEEQLETSPWPFVEADELDSMSCIQLEDIEIDGKQAGSASAVTFFMPFHQFDHRMKETFSWGWFELGEGQAPRVYAGFRAGWFMRPWQKVDPLESDELRIDFFGGTAWQCTLEDRWEVRETTGLILPYRCIVDYAYSHEYQSDIVFFPKDEDRPHLACIMEDTAISPDKILRSEVHGAITLIKHQMRNDRLKDHYTKPVMLYTFQRDQYARITQAHYDVKMGKIVLRQSRQFDLRGPKPTEDAWLLMRWMLNTPVGDTMVKSKGDELPTIAEVEEPAISPMRPAHALSA
ncbi:hypothetical protein J7T55_007915 [Diaporthe amygdali]|uniref:uncharacterized protein n=1 Tax=Phomopsis amygdali TaxID=1214568 RepID=UPI0022FEB9F0|nr:uncharacterized protein J7T55_007915 [Diaporthe amygdali]KAJ0114081.1 hypothetical protein J7T55_007915 [Diaporthe amygdali]